MTDRLEMKRLTICTFMTGLTLTAMAQDVCQGISHNGVCCPYGAFNDGECCPYGNIVDEYCCMSYQASQGQSWGNIISGNGQSCPNDAIAIAMDEPQYTSLVSSAASQLGISNVPITAASEALTSLTATATPYGTSVNSLPYTATQKAATSTGGSVLASSLPSSTSTGAGAQITLGTLYLGVVFGAGAYVL